MRKKIFSAFLVLAMVMSLMPIGAFAAESSFTDMPSDYSTAALQAAVTNGILKGTDGKILPDDNLTRAQLAAVVVRAFGATTSASLTTFTDVEADAWYYAELSKAVGMGVIQGSGSVIDPNGFVTREQTAAILARALKLADGTAADLASFTDAASVDSWAVGTMAAMVKAGYIHGADGRLNPTAYITRKDFAVMMNNIVSEYIAKAGTYDTVASGSVLVNTAGVTLKGVTVSGNLIVGDGVGDGDMTLDGVTVKGAVIVRGGGVNSLHIKGDSNISTVVVAKVDGNVRVAVEGAAKVAVVAVADGKNDVVIEGKVDTVSVQTADTPVVVQNAEVKTVEVKAEKAAVTVAETAKVETVSAEAPNASVTVAGTVTTVKATEAAKNTAVTVEKTATVTTVSTEASGTKLDVAGKVTTVTATANAADTKVDVAAGATVTTVNAAASGTQISGSGTVTNANVTGNNVKVDTNGTKTTVDKSATGTTSGGKDVAGGSSTTTNTGSSTTTNTGSSTSGGSSSGGYTGPTTTVVAGITAANLDDGDTVEDDVDTALCTNYAVSATKTSDRAYTDIAITGSNLALHKNGAEQEGFWVGVNIAAPTGATGFKYAFAASEDNLATLETSSDTDATFYTDLGSNEQKTWIKVQWLKGESVIREPLI